jgi:nitroreductase
MVATKNFHYFGGTMDIFDVFSSRYSIRAFADQPIRGEDLEKILDAVNRAPSAGNRQAFEIYQVTGLDYKRALKKAAYDQEFLVQAPAVLVFCASPTRSAERYGERGKTLYCIQDATIACTYAMLAATALGFGTVWVGAFEEQAVAEIIHADPAHRPIAMLPIGYPNETPRLRPRRSLSEIVHPVG